jgi:hypothetical protein
MHVTSKSQIPELAREHRWGPTFLLLKSVAVIGYNGHKSTAARSRMCSSFRRGLFSPMRKLANSSTKPIKPDEQVGHRCERLSLINVTLV